MSLITLLTDFGTADSYVAAMKGVILKINPYTKIVDISHEVPAQDIIYGAYLIYAAYRYFPKKTIHVVVVDPGVGTERRIVGLKAGGFFFIAPDNGILSFIVDEVKPKEIVEINNPRYFLKPISRTFHGRDIFAPCAAHLSKGLALKQLGRKVSSLNRVEIQKPSISKDGLLKGQVIHIDRFGNLITNINHKIFKHFKDLHPTKEIMVGLGNIEICGIKTSYARAEKGEPLAILGSSNLLEVSVNQEDASKILGIARGDKVILSLVERRERYG